MAYQYVREPLTGEEADRLANACVSPEEKLVVWTLLDTGLRVSELCALRPENIAWQSRELRVKGKGGPHGKKSKQRAVPMSPRVRALLEPYFAYKNEWFIGERQAQKLVKKVANRAKVSREVTPHVLRHTFATLALQKGISLAAVKKILGHDRLSTTAIYLNLTDSHVVSELKRSGELMAYFLDLFSPETFEAFARSDQTTSGFRPRHRKAASRIKPGDKLVCYMTKLSRWFGVLEIIDGPFEDDKPIFYPDADPFVVRFRVRPSVWLPVAKAVPIFEEAVWTQLSFTRNHKRGTSHWTGKVRTSLVQLTDEDGRFLESLLQAQKAGGREYPVEEADFRKLATHRVRRVDRDVTVTVPENQDEEIPADRPAPPEVRESIQVQALLATIGDQMGMDVWLPRSDRVAVQGEWKGEHKKPLERLPLNYDETTLKTIEQIDVLWLKGRSIRRAFEVEHTTSVYSGILRMADLLALQPNMDIKLHIVAPAARREKVLQEIRRPVFSLLERGPLSETCTYLSYDSIRELGQQPSLAHLRETVLDDYEEEADE